MSCGELYIPSGINIPSWLNWGRALDMVEGDVQLLCRLVEVFVEQFAHSPAEINSAARRGDWPQVTRRAHQLAGAAGAIGADVLDEAARALNRAARDALAADDRAFDRELIDGRVLFLCSHLEVTLSSARTWLNSHGYVHQ